MKPLIYLLLKGKELVIRPSRILLTCIIYWYTEILFSTMNHRYKLFHFFVLILSCLDPTWGQNSNNSICSLCLCIGDSVLCNDRNLTSVPNSICSQSPVSVDLSGNVISFVSGSAFVNCKRLQKLYMNKNNISVIDKEAFKGLYHLQDLNLGENRLKNDSLEDRFKDFENLSKLDISRQKPWPSVCPVRIWKDVPKLKILKLDALYLSLPHEMSTLTILETLEICTFSHVVYNNTFNNLKNIGLKRLKLDGYNLMEIEHSAFSKLYKLEELDLSGHRNLGKNNYESLSPSLYYINKNSFKKLVLNATCYKDRVNQIPTQFFFSISSLVLERLYMDDNSIGGFTPTFPKYIPNITTLSVGENKIGTNVEDFRKGVGSLANLRTLNVSNQLIPPDHEPIIWQHIPPKLETIFASNFFASASKDFYTMHLLLLKPLQLKLIDLTKNRLDRLTGQIDMRYTPNLLNKNLVFPVCMPNVTLDISDNGCKEISATFFDHFGHCLRSLKAAHNVLSDQLNARHFQNLSNLVELDLSYNNIENMPSDTLKNQHSLELFNLSGNVFKDFTLEIYHMENLTFIDLSNVRIDILSNTAMDNIRKQYNRAQTVQKKFRINLAGNPFICDCDHQLFLQWIGKFETMFTDFPQYSCKYEETKILYFSSLKSEILPSLHEGCRSFKWLYISLGVIAILVLSAIVGTVAYRRRWEIKYFILSSTSKRRQYQAISGDEYMFDAFVAYHHDDVLWVKDKLIPNLEDEDNLRLCVHHRDFQVGVAIEENILQSIQTSRKTIILVSRGFAKSGWCKLELHLARQHWIESGTDRLIIVLLEDVPVRDLPRTMVALFRTHTYLQWSEEAEEQKVFWLQLKRAVNKPVIIDEEMVNYPA